MSHYLKFRMPPRNGSKHYLLLTTSVEVEFKMTGIADGYKATFTTEKPAGIYGFMMALDRDEAVKRYNKSNAMEEVAFPLQTL